ncbi:HNH endonuclease signature motif containing protein, partial [Arthrobacter sp. H-02-3]|uniref:HNH endonuclease signature motif containing protein n=1 Tax=Arthrobacter sp. H-02-3 TaxID=2703675 RepID=UPI000DD1C75E
MQSRVAWSGDSGAAVDAVAASVAVLAALLGSGAGGPDRSDPAAADAQRDAGALRDADPLRDLADGLLDGLAEVARLEARTAALKVQLAADYARAARFLAPPAGSVRDRAVQEMALVAEVACVLTVSERTAGALLSEARALTTGLPLTWAALRAGTISWQHARILVDETASLNGAGAASLEGHFLDPAAPGAARGCAAGELVPSRFRAKARGWRERHHPESIEARHTVSVADRRVEFVPDRDGMAWLSARLPAETAAGIWERTTAAARALQGPAETRTLAQLRADITATWLLTNATGPTTGTTAATAADGGLAGGGSNGGRAGGGTNGGTAGGATNGLASGGSNGTSGLAGGGTGGCVVGGVPVPRAQVLVTVPVLSLLGLTDEPAVLDGYGPIPPSMARRLVAGGAGSFYRVLTDPRDGAPLEIWRSSYRLTAAQRHWLRLRDGRCPFPGCNNHSLDNEADHLLAWADGGTTGISNLGQPCPKHHRLKHSSAWTPSGATTTSPPGWLSPAKRYYPSEHQDWEPPRWPDHLPITARDTDPWPERGVPADPEPELPPDPFPDWHHFTAGHPFPAANTDDP